MVTIRLARHGAKKNPFYHVTVTDRAAPRDGRFIERVGFFNPVARGHSERLRIDLDRVDHWLSVGAQPSDRVRKLIKVARADQEALASGEIEASPAEALAGDAEETGIVEAAEAGDTEASGESEIAAAEVEAAAETESAAETETAAAAEADEAAESAAEAETEEAEAAEAAADAQEPAQEAQASAAEDVAEGAEDSEAPADEGAGGSEAGRG